MKKLFNLQFAICNLQFAIVLFLLRLAVPAAAEPPKQQPAPADVQEFVFLAEARPVLVRLHVRMNGKPLRAGHDDFMKYLFAYLDVNGDGVLTREEVGRMPTADQVLGGALGGGFGGRGPRGAPAPTPTMADLDADGDGKVTLAEFTAYYRKNGVVPFQFQLDPAGPNPFTAATAFLGGPGPEPSVEAVSRAIFDLLDANQDGKLTKEKLAAAEALLLKLDDDEDELVTTRELVPDTGSNLGQLAGMLAMGRPDRAKTTSSPTLVPVLVPGEVPADLVRRMSERYGKGDAAEKKLSRKDLGLDEATFRRLDTNGDGVLDAPELAGFVKRAPDLEVVIRLGKKEPAEARVEVVTGEGRSPLADKVRTQDGLALLDLGRTLAELRGSDEERPDRISGIVRQQTVAVFRTADTNGDGIVDAEEAKNNRQFRDLFKFVDRNGTGKVSEKDLNAYLDHLAELQKRVAAGCVTLDVSDQSRGLFDLLDTNRDGRLSVREMRQAPKLLARLDRESKGFITRDDVPRSYRLEVRRGPVGQGALNGAAAFFDRYAAPSSEAEAEQTGRGPLWFRKMDRNRDGDVSRKEFLFGEELFRKIDTDGDGLISLEEAERYDALLRKQK